MHRFFTTESNIYEGTIKITGGDARHIKNVLRLRPGDMITVSDRAGTDYECEITELTSESVTARINGFVSSVCEPEYRVTLFQALPKADKMELVIQKCVELGVIAIVPMITERTVVRPDSGGALKKAERYNRISESAAKQSGRGIVPEVLPATDFNGAIRLSCELDFSFAAYEGERSRRMRDIAAEFKAVGGRTAGIFIGPEGGFSTNEIRILSENGIKPATLGKRVLRTETAGFMSLIVFLYEMEAYEWTQ